jgi:hypothetical protein
VPKSDKKPKMTVRERRVTDPGARQQNLGENNRFSLLAVEFHVDPEAVSPELAVPPNSTAPQLEALSEHPGSFFAPIPIDYELSETPQLFIC